MSRVSGLRPKNVISEIGFGGFVIFLLFVLAFVMLVAAAVTGVLHLTLLPGLLDFLPLIG